MIALLAIVCFLLSGATVLVFALLETSSRADDALDLREMEAHARLRLVLGDNNKKESHDDH